MPDIPYPNALVDLKDRVDRHDVAIGALTTAQAVHGEQMTGVRGDVRDLTAAIGEANTMFKHELETAREEFGKRFNRFLAAVGGLILVLLPIAVDALKEALK